MDKSEYIERMKEREEEIKHKVSGEQENTTYGYEALIEMLKQIRENYGIKIEPPEREEFSNLQEVKNFVRELLHDERLENIDPTEFHARRRFSQLYSRAKEDSKTLEHSEKVKFNTENHIDYYEYVGEALNLDESDRACYFFAEDDSMPAVHMPPKRWYFVVNEDHLSDKTVEGTEIKFVNQDVTKRLPQIEDSSLDLILIKGVGPEASNEEFMENSFKLARNKLKEGGIILSDYEANVQGLKPLNQIKPKPESKGRSKGGLEDPYTGYTPFTLSKALIVYEKNT